jgi:hypothetical protein
MVKQTIGFNWGPAGTSCSTWTGVRLSDVLARCGVKSMAEGARHVWFRGPKGAPVTLLLKACRRCCWAAAMISCCSVLKQGQLVWGLGYNAACPGPPPYHNRHPPHCSGSLAIKQTPHPPVPASAGELPKGDDGSYGTSITWVSCIGFASLPDQLVWTASLSCKNSSYFVLSPDPLRKLLFLAGQSHGPRQRRHPRLQAERSPAHT